MINKPTFDLKEAHKYFSAECFNRAMKLVEKEDRTLEENEEMIQLSLTSAWHWSQREDQSSTKISISLWQISRAYSILGETENARKYGQLCLNVSMRDEVRSFHLAYAYESLARAEGIAGNREKMLDYVRKSRETIERVVTDEEKKMIGDDLESIISLVD
jgi:hypothetical protein